MRVLSQSEFEQLETKIDIPVELRHEYFPVSLRALTLKDGVSPAGEKYTIDRSDAEKAITWAQDALDCKWAKRFYSRNSNGQKCFDLRYDNFYWSTFEFPGPAKRNELISTPTMFPVNRLLFAPILDKYSISQRPGYLYLACNSKAPDSFRSNEHCSGSILLRETSYRANEKNKKARDKKIEYLKSNDYTQEEIEEILEQQRLDKLDQWQGLMGDVVHCTNSRIVYSETNGATVSNILETPFEYPKGFVRETADVLLKNWGEKSKLVQKFLNLTNNTSADNSSKTTPKRKKAAPPSFPQGEPKYVGPDSTWRNSKEPWFVQTILLARIIGGSFWHYALGSLETNMHAPINPLLVTDT